MPVKKQQLELDMEQQTGSKSGGVHQDCILSPFLFNLYAEYILRNARLDQSQAGMCLLRELSITSDMQMTTTLIAESEEKQKSLLLKVKEENGKPGSTLNIQNMKIMASGPIISWQIDEETMERSILFSWALFLIFVSIQTHN